VEPGEDGWQSRLPRYIGPYAVEDRLGVGGMGVVVGGRHRLLGRRVAIKIRHRGRDGDDDEDLLARRFRQGAVLQSELDHAHIARVYDYLESPTLQAIVMQYVDGGSVEQLLRDRHGPLEVEQAVRVAIHAADALDYAHRRGVVHRDVKPGNLMLAGSPLGTDVRVTDFGVAKQLGKSLDLTLAGANVGTLWYMPPEQFNHEAPTPRFDVYGLGATLYEMLTGHIPFRSADHAELFRRFLDGVPPPPIRSRNPKVPEMLAAVVDLALDLDASKRLQSTAAFALLLRAVALRLGVVPEAETARSLHTRCRRAGDLACVDRLATSPRVELCAALAEIGFEDERAVIDTGPPDVVPHRPSIDEEEDGVTLANGPFPPPPHPDDDDDDRTVVMGTPDDED
jgi:serine/threonine-protein kinase